MIARLGCPRLNALVLECLSLDRPGWPTSPYDLSYRWLHSPSSAGTFVHVLQFPNQRLHSPDNVLVPKQLASSVQPDVWMMMMMMMVMMMMMMMMMTTVTVFLLGMKRLHAVRAAASDPHAAGLSILEVAPSRRWAN